MGYPVFGRPSSRQTVPRSKMLLPGDTAFTAVVSGWHDCFQVGRGGNGRSSGTSGSYPNGAGGGGSLTRRYLSAGQVVSLSIGAGSSPTVVTFPDGTIVTTTAGQDGPSSGNPLPGTATGGDVNATGYADGRVAVPTPSSPFPSVVTDTRFAALPGNGGHGQSSSNNAGGGTGAVCFLWEEPAS